LGADFSGDDLAVFEENEGRPELDAEGAAEGLSGAVLDPDEADAGELREEFLKVGREGLAVAAPVGAELQKDRAFEAVDLVAS
jgi:hypothetical protein